MDLELKQAVVVENLNRFRKNRKSMFKLENLTLFRGFSQIVLFHWKLIQIKI